MLNRTNRTYIEDAEDPGQVLLPGNDSIFIRLRMEESRGRTSFTLLDDLLLDLGHGSAIIGTLVSETPRAYIADSTHIVNCSIASSTEWLSLSNCLPFNPRSRALQTSAHDSPRST